MDYEAEIDDLKRVVVALLEQMKLLLQSQPKHRIAIMIDADSEHRGSCVLPAGLKMVRGRHGKFVPCGDDWPASGVLVNEIKMQTSDGITEDKIAILELTP